MSSPSPSSKSSSFWKKALTAASRTSVRLLPTEAKLVVKKYKKLRSLRGSSTSSGFSSISSYSDLVFEDDADMPKGNKQKSKGGQAIASTVGTEEVVEEVGTRLQKLSISDEPDNVEPQKTRLESSLSQSNTVNEDDHGEHENNKVRFQTYNRRLEEIVKFREDFEKEQIKALSAGLPPEWKRNIDILEEKWGSEAKDANQRAVGAETRAQDLEDKLEGANKDINKANEKLQKALQELNDERQKNANLFQALSEKESEIRRKNDELKDMEDQLADKNKDLEDTKTKHKDERAAKLQAENELAQANASSSRRIQNLEETLRQTQMDHAVQLQTKNDELNQVIEEVERAKQNFKDALKRKVDEIEQVYSTEYERHAAAVDALEANLRKKDQELEDIKAQLDEAKTIIVKLEKEKEALMEELNDAKKHKGEMLHSITDFKRKLQDAGDKIRQDRVSAMVEDFEGEFIEYNRLLKIEEARITTVKARGIDKRSAMDLNNNEESKKA